MAHLLSSMNAFFALKVSEPFYSNTQEAVAPSQHDCKIVYRDVKHQSKQKTFLFLFAILVIFSIWLWGLGLGSDCLGSWSLHAFLLALEVIEKQ